MLAFMEHLCVRQRQKHSGEMGTFLLGQTTKERVAGKRLLMVLGPTLLHVPSATYKFKSGLVSQFFDRTDVY